MKLQQIREVTSFDNLKPAIKYLCENMQAMTWGEFSAYKRTIEAKANDLGIDLKTINKVAEDFQVYGYEVA